MTDSPIPAGYIAKTDPLGNIYYEADPNYVAPSPEEAAAADAAANDAADAAAASDAAKIAAVADDPSSIYSYAKAELIALNDLLNSNPTANIPGTLRSEINRWATAPDDPSGDVPTETVNDDSTAAPAPEA